MTINHEALKKRRAGRGSSGWKPRDGVNKIRILPPKSIYLGAWDQMVDLAIPYKMHFFKIEGRPTEVTRCLEEVKRPCPACATWRAFRKSSDPAMEQLAKDIGPSDQYLFNIIDLSNVQSGIQKWGANFTCWDKIMEIGANAAWGNVVDPADGVNFEINMTPGNRSRTGWNQYSVMPEPQRTTIMGILDGANGQPGIANWQKELDSLEDQITAAKEPEEIASLLAEMGFPPVGGSKPRAALPAASPTPLAAAPAPLPAARAALPVASASPVPVGVPAAVPVGVPAAVPVGIPAARPVAAVAVPQSVAGHSVVHYDPGPAYQPKVTEEDLPVGAPRCFGDYDPRIHRCQSCPVVADCQMKMLDS